MTNSERITTEVTSWPGVTSGHGRRGEFGFYVGRREIGHLHGDRVAHFGFPKAVAAELKAAGRITDHPIGGPGFGARALHDDADVDEAIALMRLNYDRVTASAIIRSPT
ncbi:MAG: luciferase family protein [Baekduiaceae bacterium]